MDERISQTLAAFSRIYLGGIPSLITEDSAFLSFVCVLAGTEALASYCYPELTTNGERFRRFVEVYFPEAYRPHAADLWQFRNSLVHAFSTGKFALTHHRSDIHLKTNPQGRDLLNAEDFYGGLLNAAQKYFGQVRGNEDLQLKLVDALEKEQGGPIRIIHGVTSHT